MGLIRGTEDKRWFFFTLFFLSFPFNYPCFSPLKVEVWAASHKLFFDINRDIYLKIDGMIWPKVFTLMRC